MTSLNCVCLGQDGHCGRPLPAWLNGDTVPGTLHFCSEHCLRTSSVTVDQIAGWLRLRDRALNAPAPVPLVPPPPHGFARPPEPMAVPKLTGGKNEAGQTTIKRRR